VTPGTITEEALLDARSPNCLAAIGLAGRRAAEAALAIADVSTGRSRCSALAPAALEDVLSSAWQPRELLVADSTMSACRAVRDAGHAGTDV
jgi:DNA mismatch repair protein MutS